MARKNNLSIRRNYHDFLIRDEEKRKEKLAVANEKRKEKEAVKKSSIKEKSPLPKKKNQEEGEDIEMGERNAQNILVQNFLDSKKISHVKNSQKPTVSASTKKQLKRLEKRKVARDEELLL